MEYELPKEYKMTKNEETQIREFYLRFIKGFAIGFMILGLLGLTNLIRMILK